MALWYFDWIRGLDSNDGLTPSTPKKSYDAFNLSSAAAGDRFLFRRNTPQYISTIYKGIKSGVANGLMSYYGVYGEGDLPYVTFYNPTSIGQMILNGANGANFVMEDLMFDMTGTADLRQAIYLAAQAAGTVDNVTFRRCKFTGSGAGVGLNVTIESTSTGVCRRVRVEDSEFWSNGGHGLVILGEEHVALRCKTWDNGAVNAFGGHGISTRASRTEVSSGWTLVSGNVYSRSLNANELDVFYATNLPGLGELTKNTATPTAPTSGQFGVVPGSPGTLYVNIGGNPNGALITYCWKKTTGIVIAQCEAWNNRWNRAATYHEGHGIALDDWAEQSLIIGCKVWNNEGLGLSVNRGSNNIVAGNVIEGNWRGGIVASGANCLVANNTCVNNIGEDSLFYEIGGSPLSANLRTRNNIVTTTKTNGIWFDPAATANTSQDDLVYGAATPVNGGTATRLQNFDHTPYLNPDYSLKPVVEVGGIPMRNPLDGAGTWVQGGRTYDGAPLQPGRVPIGAKMPSGRMR